MAEEKEKPLWASSPLTSIYDSDFPSDNQLGESSKNTSAQASATSGSKRSREGSTDSDSVDASEVFKVGKSQEPEASERPEKYVVKSAYKRANVARASTPATDSQYLRPEIKKHGPGRSRRAPSSPLFPEAPSFEDMQSGWDNPGGGTSSGSQRSGREPRSQRNSREPSSQHSSHHTSSHGGSRQR